MKSSFKVRIKITLYLWRFDRKNARVNVNMNLK